MKKSIIMMLAMTAVLSLIGCGKKEKAGLYSGAELTKTWQELLDEGVIQVNNGELSSGFYENETDGIGNTSSDALAGKLVLDESVTSIAHSGLRYCEKLEEVVFTDKLKTINKYAFQTDPMLKGFTIPKNLETLGDFCIEYCYNFEEFQIDKKNKTYTVIDGVVFTKDKKTLVQYPVGSKVSEYAIPDKVTTISTGGFCLCQYLNKVYIPKGVKEIGNSAFWGCTALETIRYAGSEEKWEKIPKGTEWMAYCEAEIEFK